MAEGHALRDAIHIRFVQDSGLAQATTALGVFGLSQVATTRAGAQDFAGGGDFEPLGCGFFGLDAFWTTHKLNSISYKKSANYICPRPWEQAGSSVKSVVRVNSA
jgi:hypothetical protein